MSEDSSSSSSSGILGEAHGPWASAADTSESHRVGWDDFLAEFGAGFTGMCIEFCKTLRWERRATLRNMERLQDLRVVLAEMEGLMEEHMQVIDSFFQNKIHSIDAMVTRSIRKNHAAARDLLCIRSAFPRLSEDGDDPGEEGPIADGSFEESRPVPDAWHEGS